MNLYQANSQWSKRPDDERFWTIADLDANARADRDASAVATVRAEALTFTGEESNLLIVGANGTPAGMTDFAFRQECSAVGAPAGYLRELPAKLAADCLNESHARTRNLPSM